MTSIIDDPQALSDEDLQAAISALLDEASRRNAIATIPLQIADDIAAWQDMNGTTAARRQNPDGSWPTWTQPTSALDAYREGDHVTWRGTVWVSLHDVNVARPDMSGWLSDDTPGGDDAPLPAEWVQPEGAHDAYATGDRVTYRGAVWESLIDANVWTPDAYPAGWDKVAP